MLRLRFLLLTLLLLVSTAIGQYEQHAGWYRSSWVHGINAMIPKQGLALLVNPGAQMIEQAQGNKKYPALVTGDEVVQNATFYNFTFDYHSIGEASPFYMSDFSIDEDGWYAYGGAVVGNVDGIDGEDDVLKFWASADNSSHSAKKSLFSVAKSQYLKITGKIYIPSTNTNLKNIMITIDGSSLNGGSYVISTTDSWVDFEVELQYNIGNSVLVIQGRDSTNATIFAGAGVDTDDIFYVKDVKVQRVGLVAHWVFDDYYHAQEGTGKTALQDLTANGHDLTASAGFDWENQFDGDNPAYKDGNAERFDGVDDDLYSSDTAFNPNGGNFSFAFWVSPNSTNEATIFQYGVLTTNAFNLLINSGDLRLNFEVWDNTGTRVVNLYTTNALSVGTDYLIIVTYDNSNFNIYVNGTLWNTVACSNAFNTDQILHIGGNRFYADAFISEGAYFNRALSATEVKALYGKAYGWDWDEVGNLQNDNFKQVISGGGTLTQDVTTLDNTLYKEQLIGTGVNNVNYFGETTSHTVTLTDGTWTSASVKEVTNVDEIPNFVEDFSKGGAKYNTIVNDNGDNYSEYTLLTGDGVLSNLNGKILLSGQTVQTVYYKDINVSSDKVRVTIKYTQRDSDSGVQLYKYDIASASWVLFLSIYTYSGDIDEYFDVSGCNKIRVQVRDDNTFNDVIIDNILIQEVSNGNHGLAQGGLETGQPVHPYSWEFDGVDDYVDFGNVLNINSNDVLIPIWFKTSSTASYLPLIGKMANAVNNGFMFYLSSGQPRIDIGDGTNNYSYNFGGSDLRDNQWHYVVLLLKSGVWEVWIDNILLSTWASPVNSFNSTDNLWIGRFWAGYYEGKLGIISPYLFDGQDGRPATLPQNYVNAYIKKIYNNTRRYYVAN